MINHSDDGRLFDYMKKQNQKMAVHRLNVSVILLCTAGFRLGDVQGPNRAKDSNHLHLRIQLLGPFVQQACGVR